MKRTTRSARIALAAAALVAVLTGCTAHRGDVPGTGTTVEPASTQQSACPSLEEVASLTAVAFSSADTDGPTCTYRTAADAEPSATVTVRLDAARGRTLAAVRYGVVERGGATEDASRLSAEAFTARTRSACTTWFPARDGRLASVEADRATTSGADDCALSTAVATLVGADGAGSSAPLVSVLAADRLLGERTTDAAWPWRIGERAQTRIVRTDASGYLSPGGSSSFAAAARGVARDSRAVVFVSGTAELGATRLEVLSAATAAFSAAAARAPKAEIVVVGPVVGADAGTPQAVALAADLESAAAIAGARYVDPQDVAVGASSDARLDGVADAVSAALREQGVGRG